MTGTNYNYSSNDEINDGVVVVVVEDTDDTDNDEDTYAFSSDDNYFPTPTTATATSATTATATITTTTAIITSNAIADLNKKEQEESTRARANTGATTTVAPQQHFDTTTTDAIGGCYPVFLGENENDNDKDQKVELLPYRVQKVSSGRRSIRNNNNNKYRASFLVPTYLVDRLIQHPIICRGSMFDLKDPSAVDDGDGIRMSNNNNNNDDDDGDDDVVGASNDVILHMMNLSGCLENGIVALPNTILTADFTSPYPQEMALCIAERLTGRIQRTALEYKQDQQQQPSSNISSMVFGR